MQLKLDDLLEEIKAKPDSITMTRTVWDKIRNFVIYANDRLGDTFVIPNLENATPSFLVDELGETRKRMSDLKKYEGMLNQRLQAERRDVIETTKGEPTWEGDNYGVSFTPGCRVTTDMDALQKDNPEVDITKYERRTDFMTVRTPRR